MLQLPPMPMDMFEKIIQYIDEDYPFSFLPKIILVTVVIMGIFMIASGVILIWYKRKAIPSFSTVGNLVKHSFLSWQHPILGLIVICVV